VDRIRVGVVTASDRASAGIYEDISGVAIMDTLKEYLLNELEFLYAVPDRHPETSLRRLPKRSATRCYPGSGS